MGKNYGITGHWKINAVHFGIPTCMQIPKWTALLEDNPQFLSNLNPRKKIILKGQKIMNIILHIQKYLCENHT